jgi:ribonuclease R
VLLRSLSQAVYSPENEGHFGLSLDNYAHFTSPIRRYPDLLVHRAIRHITQGKKSSSFFYRHSDMVHLGEHCSTNERRADEATRDAVTALKCEYMQSHIGESFDGIITSVTGFGVFVELNDIYIEGLIHITSLPKDYYQFEPVTHRLVGEHSGTQFQLGDSVRVNLVAVNMDERKIDFELVEHENNPHSRKSAAKSSGQRSGKKSGQKSEDKPARKKRSRRKKSSAAKQGGETSAQQSSTEQSADSASKPRKKSAKRRRPRKKQGAAKKADSSSNES